jgi:muramoyltetrapeptide carboxypeptidase
VRIVAASSPFPLEKQDAGVARLESAGFVVERASLAGSHAYLNGSDEERAAALTQALTSDADVVWLARGGYGLTRILSRIALPTGPAPIVVGFSDATALLAHLLVVGVCGVHGPLATTVANESPESFDHLRAVLERRAAGRSIGPLTRRDVRGGVDVTGWLFAANLTVLAALVGTASLPSLAGAILVVEDIGERPYRLDRVLTQLIETGALQGIRAIVVGYMSGCDEPANGGARGTRDAAPSPVDVVVERARALGVPVVSGAQVGHESPNFAIPIGASAELAGPIDDIRLTIVEDLP